MTDKLATDFGEQFQRSPCSLPGIAWMQTKSIYIGNMHKKWLYR